MQTSYAVFLYNLAQAYEQFCMTQDAIGGNAFMCHVLDGTDTDEEGEVNRLFFNATGVEMKKSL